MVKQNLHFIRALYAFVLGVASAALPFVVSHGQEVTAIEPDRGGTINLETQDPAVAMKSLHVAEGYEVSLFATEKEFPLANPVTMTFDARGRLWVATMPTYPQRLPGEDPDDKILILEDTDGDGRADKYTVFLDGLHLPAGMELGDGGLYIAQQPNLIFAKDTDGDDVADVTEVILHGFGTEDSHHALSAFTWGPGGGLYFQEGTFLHSQVETPYGPVRLLNAGVFRYKPRTFRLEVFVTYPFANPWGHIFDRWGQNFLADASGGANYFGSAITGNAYYPDKRRSMKVFTTIVRPTAGCEIVSSRHFPDEAQGNFLVNNTIGFQGIKQHRMIEEDSGFTSEEIEPLIYSEDINFRPVDLQFGPDGALYVVDWFNPLIGHMQYSLRDPDRDHGHGRIWRITYKDRPLLTPPKIDGASIPELLENLKTYEDRTRYRTRIELRRRDWNEVVAALETWVAGLDENDAQYEHHLLEALWVHQTINVFNQPLLERMLQSPEPRARAAATRVLRYWRDRVTEPLVWLEKQVNDSHPRVRLEAVLALSFFPDDAAASIALQTLQHPLDYYLEYVLRETITTLRPQWKPKFAEDRFRAVNQAEAERYLVESIPTEELKRFAGSEVVYRALLERRGLDDASRAEALSGLARFSGTDPIAELLDAMESLDNAVPWADRKLLSELSRLLLQQRPRRLAEHRAALAASAQRAMNPETRAGAYAALLSIDKGGDAAWELALERPHQFADVVRAIPITPNSSIREGLYPRITKLLSDPPRELQSLEKGIPARYVRIELPGRRKELSLAEVEVFRKHKNLALKGTASQSSTSEERVASRAIDGQTQTGAPSQTRGQSNPWFEVDLGREETIDAIAIWRSRGERYRERLDGFTLKVLDANRRVVFVRDGLPAPDRSLELDVAQGIQQDLTRAAIEALASMDIEAEARFELLSGLIEKGREVETAAAALTQIPEQLWPSNKGLQPLASVAEDLLAYVQGVPTDRLSSEEVQAVFAAGDRLARALPESQSSLLRAALANAGVTVVTIRPIPHLMLFEQTEFTVKSGRPVEIVFENIDVMPHNVVVTAPGRMEMVGRAADAMQTDADAQERHYVPDLDEVLYATRLLKPGERQRLAFLAPQEPGDYPYVCTYPGHWITMYGVMHVVEELDASMLTEKAQPIAPLSEARQVVRYWELDDLKPVLPQARIGRSFAAGKELFSIVGCVQCHQMRGEGRSIGPDLTEIGEKYNALGVLEHVLDPSLEVAAEYQGYIVQTKDEFYAGPIVNQNNATVQIRANSLEPEEVTEILRSDIVLMEPSSLSTMPTDLLITLQKEEILDLLAFLLSGGDQEHAAFSN